MIHSSEESCNFRTIDAKYQQNNIYEMKRLKPSESGQRKPTRYTIRLSVSYAYESYADESGGGNTVSGSCGGSRKRKEKERWLASFFKADMFQSPSEPEMGRLTSSAIN